MKTILTISILLLGLFSCNIEKQLIKHPELCRICQSITKDSTVVKDTTITVSDESIIDWGNSDSVWIQLLMGCDSLNNVYIKQIKDNSKEKVTERVITKWKISDNTIDLQQVIAELRRTIEKKEIQLRENYKTITIKEPYPVINYKMYWWGWALSILALVVGIFIGKKIM